MSIGIRVDENRFIPIIPKNSTLPARKNLFFTTLNDYQTNALIIVYEDNEKEVEKKKKKKSSARVY